MPWYDGEFCWNAIFHPVAFNHVKIRAADATGTNLNQNLSMLDGRLRDILHGERSPFNRRRLAEHCGLQVCFSLRAGLFILSRGSSTVAFPFCLAAINSLL